MLCREQFLFQWQPWCALHSHREAEVESSRLALQQTELRHWRVKLAVRSLVLLYDVAMAADLYCVLFPSTRLSMLMSLKKLQSKGFALLTAECGHFIPQMQMGVPKSLHCLAYSRIRIVFGDSPRHSQPAVRLDLLTTTRLSVISLSICCLEISLAQSCILIISPELTYSIKLWQWPFMFQNFSQSRRKILHKSQRGCWPVMVISSPGLASQRKLEQRPFLAGSSAFFSGSQKVARRTQRLALSPSK